MTSIKRQALHAFLIGFKHPNTAEGLHFLSPLPPDIKALLDNLEGV
jgi:23S rRNA pseudouridine1911/1915/1917 synthase